MMNVLSRAECRPQNYGRRSADDEPDLGTAARGGVFQILGQIRELPGITAVNTECVLPALRYIADFYPDGNA